VRVIGPTTRRTLYLLLLICCRLVLFFLLFKCFSLINLVLIGVEVQLVEGVGTGNTAWTLVSLLTIGIDVLTLVTTFEGPGADVSSLAAFKVVRMFLSIITFS
jgi:small-conductance mechanosensitive channel